MATKLLSIRSLVPFLLLALLSILGSSNVVGQTNVALTATSSHSSGGATGSPDYSAVNYNDGIIAPNAGPCTSSATPWGWVNTGASITYTWPTPVTFDKVVLYKSNRPMTGASFDYWNGSAFIPFHTYSGSTCTEDSVSFLPVTTTIFRISGIAGTNPNHREIQCWSTPTTACVTPPTQPTSLVLTPGIYNVSGSFTAAVPVAERYLTIMTTTSTPPSAPVDGVNYTVGSSALGGVVVDNGVSTSFYATGLTPVTQYWYWVYSFNAFCIGGPVYKTTAPLSGTITTNTCSMSGIRTIGATGDYSTIAAAITAINNGGLTGPIALEIQTSYAGEAVPIVIGNIPCASATNTITIRPQGPLNLTSSGTDILVLDGARYVTIDGRVGSTGSTSVMTIGNTALTGSVIRFINDASNNVIRYCTLTGVNTNTSNATVCFGTTTGTTGNDNNLIDYCDILDGSSTPLYSVLSLGTAGMENSGNTISNCNIANFFQSAIASRGVFLSTGSTNWTINNNRFYQTATRAYGSALAHCPIAIVNAAGNGFSVTNNTIGFSNSAGTGTYFMTSTTTMTFQGILMTVGTGAVSVVQGNTVTNINYSGTSGLMTGIAITAGNVDVTGNTIGATTGNGAIVKTNTVTSSPAFIGISTTAVSPGQVDILNNNIGSITVNGSTTTIGAGVYGISATSTATTTITGNLIGSLTTANSIQSATVSTGTQLVYGIIATITSTTLAPPVIANNTIANITSAGTGTANLTAGVLFNSSSSGQITGNVIRNISSATANTVLTGQLGLSGIAYTGATGSAMISQNTINTLIATNNTAVVSNVAGVAYTGSLNGSIVRNRIFDLRNLSTGTTATTPPKAIGISIYSPSTSVTIANNMISLGNGQTTNTSFTGIMQGSITSSAVHRIYYNTVNIEGSASSGALPTACLIRGNYSATVYTTPFDVQNNIFNNTRTGGTGKHYAIANTIGGTASSTGWAAGASNYNLLNGNAATIGFWSGDRTYANWQLTTLCDANSGTASAVTFANNATGDLHINMGLTANNIESHGTVITGYNTDFDNDARPGPVGSVNGGAITTDLGADEFDGVPNDNLPPTITYTALLGSCGTGDRTFSATIADYSGVPTSGTLRPKVYYKKGAGGTWFSRSGTLASGTGTSGTWNFTVVAADMGGLAIGDVVYYYVIAQDNIAQVGSVPGIGLVAANVNSVSTPPASPNTYATLATLGGSYNIGVGGDYTTLSAAIAEYNPACLSGPVVFNLTDASYPSESFPILIGVNPFASSVNTLTIKPATGVTTTISGSSTAGIIKLNGADYIVIDGSNNGTNSRNLTIENNATTTSAVIWNASLGGAGNGADNNTFKNLNVKAGANLTATVIGISSSATTAVTTQGDNNNNLTIRNCSISKAYHGISVLGTAALPHNDLLITGNSIGSDNPSEYVQFYGVYLVNQTNPVLSKNTIFNMKNTTLTNIAAVEMGLNITGAQIIENNITGIWQQSTGGWGAYGIDLNAAGCSNILIANNFISDIQTENYAISNFYNPFGIRLYTSATNVKVYNNSVSLFGNISIGTGTGYSACLLVAAAMPGLDVRNNIFSNTMTHTVSGSKANSIVMYVAGLSFANINNNDYYGTSSATTAYSVGTNGSTTYIAGLPAWQTFTGQDANSIIDQPVFVAADDLHLQITGANVPFIGGTPLPGITTDIDGNTRNLTTPVIGAHEVAIPNCTVASAGVATAADPTICETGITTISALGSSAGVGTSYSWQSSADSVSWTAISGATSINYTPGTAITATTFYRVVVGCSFSSTLDSSATKVAVQPYPGPVTGPSLICINSAYSFGSVTAGGSWSSSNAGIVAIAPSSGNATTSTGGGTATISYSLPTGCATTRSVTVNTVLPVVTASATPSLVCTGESSALSGATNNPGATTYSVTGIPYAPILFTPTGTFNSTTTPLAGSNDDGYYAAVLPFAVDFYGVNYPAGTTCYVSTNGYFTFGTGMTSTYINSMPNAAFPATIALFGRDMIITTAGSITYGTTGTAPNRKFIVSYNNVPDFSSGLIENGQLAIYEGSGNIEFHVGTAQATTHTFGIQSASGTYSAVVPGQNNTAVGFSNSSWRFVLPTPVVSWTADPSLTITNTLNTTANPILANTTYTLTVTASNGCAASATTTVNTIPPPSPIVGADHVCVGFNTTLTNPDGGGTWNSSNTAVATIGLNTGLVSGVSVGTVVLSYTFTGGTGCTRTMTFNVTPLPAAIAGIGQACEGGTTTLTNLDAGGTWASTNPTNATINAGSGVLTGVAAGTALISYILPTGCVATRIASVNPLPNITVTPTTATTFCIGNSTSAYSVSATMPGFSLLNQNFNGGLGAWTIQNLVGAPASQWKIVSSGFDGTSGDGTSMLQAAPMESFAQVHTRLISPSFSTVGYGAATLTFNQYLLSDVSDAIVRIEFSTDGGTVWTTLADYGNTITGSPTWSAAVPNASISIPGTALGQANVKIRWNYDGSFYAWFLDNIKVSATLPPATYSWSGGADLSCTTCANPTITPSASGANIYTASAISSAGCISTGTVTVNADPLPAIIGGNHEVCIGLTTTLTNADAGGTWSVSNPAVATIDITTGTVSALTAGTTFVTYILPTGCVRTTTVTVNALPEAITGLMSVCEGLTTTLSNVSAGGNWSSDDIAIATVDASGIVTGQMAGNTTITYTLPTTCISTATVVVNPLPAAIGGTLDVCEGLTTTLTNTSAGGTWMSDATGVLTIDATSGLATGVAYGNAMITYTLPTGCIMSAEATVNPLPDVITGIMNVCVGLVTTMSNVTPGGDWTSSNVAAATVDASGIVSGIAAGNTTITYTLPTGCIRTADVVVNPLPAVITGTQDVCEGLSTDLDNASVGGSWTSNDLAIATVASASGIVTGVSAGNAMITYTLPTGCMIATEATVNALPDVITGTMDVCVGLNVSLADATIGGTWSSGTPATATIDASNGMVTGVAAGNTMITYMLATGCIQTAEMTVNPLPVAITGTLDVCEGLTTTVINTTGGGMWSTADASIASVDAGTGVVNGILAGNTMITYTLPTGCIMTAEATVNALPAAITGTMDVCEGLTIVLSDATTGGAWSSSDVATASVDAAGMVTGVAAGNATITYMVPTGCIATANVLVNPLPAPITGGMQVCTGLMSTLASTTTGGVWISGTTATATVDNTTGVVTGITAGVADITYTLATGCLRTAMVTVDSQPAAITGATQVCATATTILADVDAGGAWTSADVTVAVDAATGAVTGVTAGTATITYTMPTTCKITTLFTVNALPVVYTTTGGGNYCAGGTGVNIGTDNSETGITYDLYNGTTLAGTMTGVTGAGVDFGLMTAAGTYTVLATSPESCNSNMMGSAVVTIIPLVTPAVTLTNSTGDTICAGINSTFTAAPVNGGTTPAYTWTVNGSPVVSTTDVYSYVPVDGDIVAVTLASSEACPSPSTATDSRTMVVVSNETPVVSVVVVPGNKLCQGSMAVFNATETWGGSAPSFTWYKNGVLTSATGSVYSYVPVNGDVVFAKLNSNYRCPIVNDVSSNSVTMDVDSVFIPIVTLEVLPGVDITAGQHVHFFAHVTKGGPVPTYQWFVNNIPVDGEVSESFGKDALSNGDSVTCVVYGTGDCSYFTFNSVKMRVSTGTIDPTMQMSSINLVPNPNTGAFVVSGNLATKANAEVTLEVSDMLGQIVYTGTTIARGGTLNESVKLNNTLANGMYLLNVRTGTESKVFHFVIKQ